MYRFLFLLWCTSLSTILAADALLKPVLVLGSEYPPFVSETEPDQGNSVRYLNQLLHAKGWQAQMLFLPPARAAEYADQKTDWMLSFYPPQNNPNAPSLVIKPASINYSFFRLKKSTHFRWNNLSELAGLNVICMRQQTSRGDVAAFERAKMKVMYVDSLEQGFRMLLARRGDLLLTAQDTGEYFLQKMQLPKDYFEFAQNNIRVYSHQVYINTKNPQIESFLSSLK